MLTLTLEARGSAPTLSDWPLVGRLSTLVISRFDMDAMAPTVKLIKQLGKSTSAFFLVNKGRSKAINDECALALATAYGLPAINTHISHRLPIQDAGTAGLAGTVVVYRALSQSKGGRSLIWRCSSCSGAWAGAI